jgi:hypothetical protein
MKRRTLLSAAFAAMAVLLALPARALAWDPYGHMVVAASAWGRITNTKVKKRISDLLKLNPQYDDWVKGVPAARRARVAFVRAATWPDFIKEAPGYEADGKNGGNTPPHVAASGRNIGYTDKLMHKYWHFIDLPFSPDGTATQEPDFVNAKTQIAAFRTALKSKSPTVSDDVKSYDLVWLEHIVGDVHQPLHCTSRFTASQKDGDNGGNFVKLSGDPAHLHTFWDDLLGTAGDHDAAIAAAHGLTAPSTTLAKVTDEAVWIDESFEAAKAHAYKAPIGGGDGPYAVTAAYTNSARALARKRVALAGARLARLLTDALK